MEIVKWVTRGLKVAGISALVGGGAYLYQQNQDLRLEVESLKTKTEQLDYEKNYLAQELVRSDVLLCYTSGALLGIMGQSGTDCPAGIQDEIQRFEENGFDMGAMGSGRNDKPMADPTPRPLVPTGTY